MAKLKTIEPVVEQRTQPPAAISEPTQAEIQERAYYRYVDRGRIDGFDREDWYLAETELRGGEQPAVLGLIRFRGHLPKGGYDVPHVRQQGRPASPAAVH